MPQDLHWRFGCGVMAMAHEAVILPRMKLFFYSLRLLLLRRRTAHSVPYLVCGLHGKARWQLLSVWVGAKPAW